MQQGGLQVAQESAADAQQQLQASADTLHEVQQLQQQLQAAIAQARHKAEAAETEALSGAASDDAEGLADQISAQQQQQKGAEGGDDALPVFDATAATAELQPLLQAEQEASQQLQQQWGAVQELKGQLAAAAKRRKKYERLQTADSSSSSSSGGGGAGHICEQCLQPINVELYQR